MLGFGRMKLMREVRLLLALLALAFCMAGPAAAAANMVARPATLDVAPCHEAGRELGQGAHPGIHASASHMGAPMGSVLNPDPARPHLCCVISQLVAPLLAPPALRLPEARPLVLRAGPEPSSSGREPAIPVPPPRPA